MNAQNVEFNPEEDFILTKLVRMFGTKNWKNISMFYNKIFKNNCPKSTKDCKSRWYSHLDPSLRKKGWSLIEENIFFESQQILGNKWATISKFLPGRTDNNIKNHFYSTFRRNIRRFLKGRPNLIACIKEKIKVYYTLLYIREKYSQLCQFYDKETNELNLEKAKKKLQESSSNVDYKYISELIVCNQGSVTEIDNLINFIGNQIANEKGSTTKVNSDAGIRNVIKGITLKSCLTSCMKFIRNTMPSVKKSGKSLNECNSKNSRSNSLYSKNKIHLINHKTKFKHNEDPDKRRDRKDINSNNDESKSNEIFSSNYMFIRDEKLNNLIEVFTHQFHETTENSVLFPRRLSMNDFGSCYTINNNPNHQQACHNCINYSDNNKERTSNYLSQEVIQRLKSLPNFSLFREILEKVTLNNILFSFLGKEYAEDGSGENNNNNLNNSVHPEGTINKPIFDYLFEQFYENWKNKTQDTCFIGHKIKRGGGKKTEDNII